MTKKNIDFWKKIEENPSDAYKAVFEAEKKFLRNIVKTGFKVLDVGCGDGRNILSVVDIAGEVVGIDIDTSAVEDAQNNLKDFQNVKIINGSAFNLPFDNSEFDVVIISMTLVNFADYKEKALNEMRRVVKDEGRIVVSVYSENSMNERVAMYNSVSVPIEKILPDEVVFDESVGAHTSKQFSINAFEDMIKPLGLEVDTLVKVKDFVYIFSLKKSV